MFVTPNPDEWYAKLLDIIDEVKDTDLNIGQEIEDFLKCLESFAPDFKFKYFGFTPMSFGVALKYAIGGGGQWSENYLADSSDNYQVNPQNVRLIASHIIGRRHEICGFITLWDAQFKRLVNQIEFPDQNRSKVVKFFAEYLDDFLADFPQPYNFYLHVAFKKPPLTPAYAALAIAYFAYEEVDRMVREQQGSSPRTDQDSIQSLEQFGESRGRQLLGGEVYDFRTLARHYEFVRTRFLSRGQDHLGGWYIDSESKKSLNWLASVKQFIKRFHSNEPELGTISDQMLTNVRTLFKDRNEFYSAFRKYDASMFSYALAYAYLVKKDRENGEVGTTERAEYYAKKVVNYENFEYDAFVKLGAEILSVIKGRRNPQQNVPQLEIYDDGDDEDGARVELVEDGSDYIIRSHAHYSQAPPQLTDPANIPRLKKIVENVRTLPELLSESINGEKDSNSSTAILSDFFATNLDDDETMATDQIYLRKEMTDKYKRSTRELCHRSKDLFNDLNYVIKAIAFHFDTTDSVNEKAYVRKFGNILDMIFPRFPDGKRFRKHVKEHFSKANPQAGFVEFFANYALHQAQYAIDEFKEDPDNLKAVVQEIVPTAEPAYLLNFFQKKHLHAFRKLNKKYFKGLSTKNRDQLKKLMFNIRKENKSKFDKKLYKFLDGKFSYYKKDYTYRSFYEGVYSEIWLRIILLFLQVFRETEIASQVSLNEIMEDYAQFLESGLGLKSLGFKYNLLILVKHLDSYKNIGIAKVAQNIAKTFCDVWDSYVKSMDRYFRELEKGKEPDRPMLPAYKPSDGVWLVQYDSAYLLSKKYFRQHIRDTFRLHSNRKKSFLSATSEFRFPNEHHDKLPPIRFRLLPQYDKRDPLLFEKLRSFGRAGNTIDQQIELGREKFKEWAIEQFFANFRTIEINPIGNSDEYNLNISYIRKKDLNYKLDQNKCLAIDLGLSILSTAVSNTGDTPLLYRGGRIKRANHLFITHGQKAQRELYITNHLIYQHEHREETILDAAKDHRQKFIDDVDYHYYSKLPEGFSWKEFCQTDQWKPQHKHVKKLKEQVKKHSELAERFEKSAKKLEQELKAMDSAGKKSQKK
ncbi:MAG: hypothetical protein GF383_07400, partial [Candidatus Lokiarchaeota archaeon]|nr:hypothetical protein [Candidatus Lokiarchaeota archaeon]MBD3340015.1 hypothetical protein [Candidatus Lokiarchaeota archaeon]